MSTNRYAPHILVLPEDDANHQLANGFCLETATRQIQVLPAAGGWLEVLKQFESTHASTMDNNSNRYMVLLIDFDGVAGRLEEAKQSVPGRLRERVLILGAWTEPERLKATLGPSFERIGRTLAQECRQSQSAVWNHELVRHNSAEVDRLGKQIRAILFPA